MFRQGDLEKQRGYAVSPLMDRTKTGITKSQTGVSAWGCLGWCSPLAPFKALYMENKPPGKRGGMRRGWKLPQGLSGL